MAYNITEACKGCQACVRPCPTQAISGERHAVNVINPVRCIDCGTCGRVCPYGAVLGPEGEAAERVKRADWLSPVINRERCVSCGLCITICPVSCLDMVPSGSKMLQELFPSLTKVGDCIGCGFCELVCPVAAITLVPRKQLLS